MPRKKQPPVQQTAIGDGNIQIVGDQNVVNQTIIQKFFNIFKSDAETTEQRNRRIMLGHVENFWIKGILEKSLHGAALLELGIKENPDDLKYPWAIKREATNEILPAGKSMLEIFQEIGMGRSLLILGSPGSGKTTMLLELTRQLLERAREDVVEPIPVVFNLSSWTEKLTLGDWLARELNIIYTIPKKVAPIWVKENKMLLLLDGLDEVRPEVRDKCVDVINQFKKENGLTSMVVCSRSQDYVDLETRLFFDGAIEIQPLTADQVRKYFKRFSKGLAGIRQVLEKDTLLRELAETPLFLSIMTIAYRDTQSKDILISENLDLQRKHLFDTYMTRMFERSTRTVKTSFTKHQTLQHLGWLAGQMSKHNIIVFRVETMQPSWLGEGAQRRLYQSLSILPSLIGVTPMVLLSLGLAGMAIGEYFGNGSVGLIVGLVVGLVLMLMGTWKSEISEISETIELDKSGVRTPLDVLFLALVVGISMLPCILCAALIVVLNQTPHGLIYIVRYGAFLILLSVSWVLVENAPPVVQHYILRFALTKYQFLPRRLNLFLNHCVDLIFLRRAGGGYIFIHRLLMEHFATMYSEQEKAE